MISEFDNEETTRVKLNSLRLAVMDNVSPKWWHSVTADASRVEFWGETLAVRVSASLFNKEAGKIRFRRWATWWDAFKAEAMPSILKRLFAKPVENVLDIDVRAVFSDIPALVSSHSIELIVVGRHDWLTSDPEIVDASKVITL